MKTDLSKTLRRESFVGAEEKYLFAVSDADGGEVGLCEGICVW